MAVGAARAAGARAAVEQTLHLTTHSARRPARRDRNIGRNRKEEEAVMTDAYICDFARTPFGRYAGSLKDVRTDDLAAHPLRVLRERNSRVDWAALDDCYMGCANQAGEDNRNVARMATLLAGFPVEVPGATVNRLCGSGLDAVGTAARPSRRSEERGVGTEWVGKINSGG